MEEGKAYSVLGQVYSSLGKFDQAIKFHNLHLNIAMLLRDRAGEGEASQFLGIAYKNLC